MKEYLENIHQNHSNDSLQEQVHRIFQTWQVAAREWSSIYCSLENSSGRAKLKRMKRLEALENKINYIADQYELARRAI
jgi:hypothetical protein